jgi:hypothetical protein
MPDLLLYWRPETVDATESDFPLTYAGSAQFDRVTSGDVLWVVTSRARGHLELVARIEVERLTADRGEAHTWIGRQTLWESPTYALGVQDGARPKQNTDISDLALDLRFEGDPDRLPQMFSGQHLQSMRLLTAESAATLEDRWIETHRLARRNPAWQRDELEAIS